MNSRTSSTYAVLIGFICYSSAQLILAIDVGQPLRGWFIFWHANVHSMLTEVAFCLTCYFIVLTIEYIPLILDNRQIQKVPFFSNLTHNMHSAMACSRPPALSLLFPSGLPGRRRRRALRPALRLPRTHPHLALHLLSFHLVGRGLRSLVHPFHHLADRENHPQEAGQGRSDPDDGQDIRLDDFYLHHRQKRDTLYWMFATAPSQGLSWDFFYQNNPLYGKWILFTEIIICGFLPGLLLVFKSTRENAKLRVTALVLGIIGVCLNRWVMVLQTLAAPVMPFDSWVLYIPSWQEVATTILPGRLRRYPDHDLAPLPAHFPAGERIEPHCRPRRRRRRHCRRSTAGGRGRLSPKEERDAAISI
jgi:menaquinone reductase, integral membrane subunit